MISFMLYLPITIAILRYLMPMRWGDKVSPARRNLFILTSLPIAVAKYLLYTAFRAGIFPNTTYAILSQLLMTAMILFHWLALCDHFSTFCLSFCLYWLLESVGNLGMIIVQDSYWQAVMSPAPAADQALKASLLMFLAQILSLIPTIAATDLLVRYIRKRRPRTRRRLEMMLFILMWFITLLSFVTTFLDPAITVNYALMLILLLLFLLIFTVFLLCQRYRDVRDEAILQEVSRTLSERQLAQQEYHRRQLTEFLTQMGEHLTQIRRDITEGQSAEALALANDLTARNERMIPRYSYCPIADAALASCDLYCREHDIRLNITGMLPAELPLPAEVQSGLFFNLFNNAAEAAAASGLSDPLVEVDFVCQKGQLIVRTRNSAAGSVIIEGNGLRSTKKEPGHGYGTRILQDLVSSYQGSYSLEFMPECSRAEATVILPLPEV